MSYKPQVFVQGEWASNTLAFATEPEAQAYGLDLMRRWTLVESYRTIESTDPAKFTYVDHELKDIPQ